MLFRIRISYDEINSSRERSERFFLFPHHQKGRVIKVYVMQGTKHSQFFDPRWVFVF